MLINPPKPIEQSEIDELDPVEKWTYLENALWAHRPGLASALGAVSRELRERGTLSPRLLELLRLRVQFHNQCRACMTVRHSPEVSEDVVCSLESPDDAPDLSLAEKAALRFADMFVLNHVSIGESEFNSLREHFDDGQIVELSVVCAMRLGVGRISAVWRVYEDYPMSEWPPVGEPMAPWTSGVHIDAHSGSKHIFLRDHQ
jgi:alkylhydroperoxidase family enzyme